MIGSSLGLGLRLVLVLFLLGCASTGTPAPESSPRMCLAYGTEASAFPRAVARHDLGEIRELVGHDLCFAGTARAIGLVGEEVTLACRSGRAECQAACEGAHDYSRPGIVFPECDE